MSKKITKLAFFDFDGVLSDSPEKELGMSQWALHHGKPFPHVGWWSKPESLDLNVFDIQPIKSVFERLQALEEHAISILLTNRVGKLKEAVNAILSKHGIALNMLTFRRGADTKGERIEKLINQYPDITDIEFYDDMPEHLESAKYLIGKYPDINFRLYIVSSGNIIRY